LFSTALEDLLGRLDAGRRRSAEVELDLPAIDVRKKVTADEDEHDSVKREHQNGYERDYEATGQQQMQQFDVFRAQPLENLLEAAVNAGEPASSGGLGATMLAFEHQTDGDGRQGSGQAVRGEHGEDDGEAERRETALGERSRK
jgi:hypothetical protein